MEQNTNKEVLKVLDQGYLDAVKRFNHEIFPKIRLAQSFVACMPNAMRDIARELGEDSYPCRRLKSIGWDQVQETLMEALEDFEKRERRRIHLFIDEAKAKEKAGLV